MIYVLNLKRRPDRAAKISRALGSLGLKFEFIEGVDWQDSGSYPKQEFISNGYACNVLSQHKALETFLKSGHQHAIIMEDDAVLDPNVNWPVFLQGLEGAMARDEIDYLQLGFVSHFYSLKNFSGYLKILLNRLSKGRNRRRFLNVANRRYELVMGESLAGSHFYACSRRFAEMTPPLMRPQWVGYDGFLDRLSSATVVMQMGRMRRSLAEQDSRQTQGRKPDSDIVGSSRG